MGAARPPGHDSLFQYESALNHVVDDVPAVLMCLYDLQKFGAGMLVEVLRTHPKILLDRTVIDNPLYVHPARYTAPTGTGTGTVGGVPDPTIAWDADRGAGAGRDRSSLTDAERRVVSCVAAGMTNRQIGDKLYVSHHTVDAHLKHIYAKLDIHSRVELTVLAMKHDS